MVTSRFRPFCPPANAFIFIARRIQHSQRSSMFILFSNPLTLSRSRVRESIFAREQIPTSSSMHSRGLEPANLTFSSYEVNPLDHRGRTFNCCLHPSSSSTPSGRTDASSYRERQAPPPPTTRPFVYEIFHLLVTVWYFGCILFDDINDWLDCTDSLLSWARLYCLIIDFSLLCWLSIGDWLGTDWWLTWLE